MSRSVQAVVDMFCPWEVCTDLDDSKISKLERKQFRPDFMVFVEATFVKTFIKGISFVNWEKQVAFLNLRNSKVLSFQLKTVLVSAFCISKLYFKAPSSFFPLKVAHNSWFLALLATKLQQNFFFIVQKVRDWKIKLEQRCINNTKSFLVLIIKISKIAMKHILTLFCRGLTRRYNVIKKVFKKKVKSFIRLLH